MTRNPFGARQNLGEEEISEMAVDKSTPFVEDHVFFHFFPIKDVFAPIIFQYVTRLGVFSECIYGRLKIANSPQLRVFNKNGLANDSTSTTRIVTARAAGRNPRGTTLVANGMILAHKKPIQCSNISGKLMSMGVPGVGKCPDSSQKTQLKLGDII